MLRFLARFGLVTVLSFGLASWSGCAGTSGGNGNTNGNTNSNTNGNTNDNTNGNTNDNANGNENANANGNGNGNGGGTLTAVKTNIDVHNSGRISVGDDVLVYGYGGFAGVDYIIPSAGDTTGRGLPEGDTYNASDFAAMGKKIALTRNFLITIYDTQTDSSVEIAKEQVRLTNVPVGVYGQGHFKADGNLLAVRNDSGTKVTVIDVTNATPEIITFANDIAGNADEVAIDANTMQVAAATGDTFVIYDINDPTATPLAWDVSGQGGIGDAIVSLSDGYIFYEDGEAFGNARFLKVDTGQVAMLAENPSGAEMFADGGHFCYFVDRDAGDSNGSDYRSAIGATPGPGTTLAGDEMIDGSTTNNGFVGWSQQCTITPGGTYAFLSGKGSIGSGEFLQVSTGGAFALVNDPDGSSPYGLPATDVDASSSLVGFKTGDGTTAGPNTKVGYIILSGSN